MEQENSMEEILGSSNRSLMLGLVRVGKCCFHTIYQFISIYFLFAFEYYKQTNKY